MRALEGVLGEWVTDNVLGGTLLETLEELVVDTLLNIDAGTGAAALAVVVEDAEVDPGDGVVNVGIVEDNVGRLASKLEGDPLEVGAGGGLHDGATDNGGASEGDLVDVHVCGDGGTGDLAEAGDDVDDTRGEASLLDELGGVQGRERSLLSGLDDDDVASSNSRTNLPCPHEQREIPWDDLTANTNLEDIAVSMGMHFQQNDDDDEPAPS